MASTPKPEFDVIRLVEPRGKNAVQAARLCRHAFKEAPYNRHISHKSAEDLIALWVNHSNRSQAFPSRIWVALHGKRVVGVVAGKGVNPTEYSTGSIQHFFQNHPTFECSLIAVHPDYRRRAVTPKLDAVLETHAREVRAHLLLTQTLNPARQRYLLQNDFERIPERIQMQFSPNHLFFQKWLRPK